MSTSDWLWKDLELCGTIRDRIYGYSDRLEPQLQDLLDKYRDLGQKLHELAIRLHGSSTRYHDPDLERHLHKADCELDADDPTNDKAKRSFALRLLKRRRSNGITARKIKELHFEVISQINTADNFRIRFLFNHAYQELDYIVQRLRQQAQPESDPTSTPDTTPLNQNEPEPITDGTQSSPSTLGSIDNRDAQILADAPIALNIARLIWSSGADIIDTDQRRRRPDYPSSTSSAILPRDEEILAKQNFLNEVLSLIEQIQIGGLRVPARGPSRDVLDRLARIVSQAAELRDMLSSPEISALEATTSLSSRQNRQRGAPTSPVRGSVYATGGLSLPTPPQTTSHSNSPRVFGQPDKIARGPIPSHSIPLSPPESGITVPVHNSSVLRNSDGPWRELNHSEPSSGPNFPLMGPPAINSSFIVGGNNRTVISPHPSAVAFGKRPAGREGATQDVSGPQSSWVKISCLEFGLKPSFCTLKTASLNGKRYLLADLTTKLMRAPSPDDYGQRTLGGSPSSSSVDHQNGDRLLFKVTTYEHLILPDTRSFPSVKHPEHEGPGLRPETPYTITFKSKQSLREYTDNTCLEEAGDLQYIFSEKTERDRIRSILCDKRLLFHAGVQTIKFSYIASQLVAVSLWEATRRAPLTITFNRNTTATRGRPLGEVGYEIVALLSDGGRPKADEPLELSVWQVTGPGIVDTTSVEVCRLFFTKSDDKAALIAILTR